MFTHDQILNFINAYGYAFIFLGTFLEGELVIIAAGFLSHTGLLNFWWTALVGFLGAITGDNFWFFIGNLGGAKIVNWYARTFRISQQKIEQAETVVHKHGFKAVFVSRFVFGTRLSTAILAGSFNMPKRKFFTANVLGAMVWVLIMTFLGYLFGKSFVYLENLVKKTEIALLILAVLAIIILIFAFSRKSKDKST